MIGSGGKSQDRGHGRLLSVGPDRCGPYRGWDCASMLPDTFTTVVRQQYCCTGSVQGRGQARTRSRAAHDGTRHHRTRTTAQERRHRRPRCPGKEEWTWRPGLTSRR
ncbi:hypothetical protein F750_6191 [Streptomyces sp. PAMC 26508]|nr:hypothetical protein F750_6191 [Streptomyces sp. PAMC 26508]